MRRSSSTSISAPTSADRQRGQQHRRPRTRTRPLPEPLDQRVGDVDAEHVERAVREVDDARDAEDQRQPGRDQEQRRRAGQPVEQLDEEARRRPSAAAVGRLGGRPGDPGAGLSPASAGRSLRTSCVGGLVRWPVERSGSRPSALAVLDRGRADVGAHRRLVVERAVGDRARTACRTCRPLMRRDQLLGVGRARPCGSPRRAP